MSLEVVIHIYSCYDVCLCKVCNNPFKTKCANSGVDTIMATVGELEASAKLYDWTMQLRECVRKEATAFDERTLLAAEAFRETEGEPFRILRVAHATSHILRNMPIRIRHGEILVGWHPNTHVDGELKEALDEATAYLRKQNYWVNASEEHMALDYPTILSLGLGGIKERIDEFEASLDVTEPGTPEKRAFYQAARASLEAFQNFILRYAEFARELERSATDPDWRYELRRIAETCEHIATEPPRTFREAIQLTWFAFLAVAIEAGTTHHCFGPGRIDQYLLPFYEADRENGVLDDAEVDTLLAQLFIKCNEFSGPSMSAVIIG
ncbi:MAG TPA: hypothetical protein EYP10_10925, partial [Armatimonadetes bacterium]|nr:hypothetical protein [Armatimonadota bacterium]